MSTLRSDACPPSSSSGCCAPPSGAASKSSRSSSCSKQPEEGVNLWECGRLEFDMILLFGTRTFRQVEWEPRKRTSRNRVKSNLGRFLQTAARYPGPARNQMRCQHWTYFTPTGPLRALRRPANCRGVLAGKIEPAAKHGRDSLIDKVLNPTPEERRWSDSLISPKRWGTALEVSRGGNLDVCGAAWLVESTTERRFPQESSSDPSHPRPRAASPKIERR